MAHIFTEESGKQNRRKLSMSGCWDHIKAMFAPYEGHVLGHIGAMFLLFLQYLCFYMPEMVHIFSGESCKLNKSNNSIFNYLNHIRAILGPY